MKSPGTTWDNSGLPCIRELFGMGSVRSVYRPVNIVGGCPVNLEFWHSKGTINLEQGDT